MPQKIQLSLVGIYTKFPSMTIDRIAPEALRLSLEDRVQLAATLWESIEDPYSLAADRDDEAAIELALTRDAEIESGAVAPLSLSLSDLMTRLRK